MAENQGRREFLRLAAVAGGAGLLASCSRGGAAGPAGTRTSAAMVTSAGAAPRAAATPRPADWTALAHDLAGTLVRPGDASYTVSKRLFDPRFDSLRPAGIAYCRNPHDVSTCLAFVRKFGVKVAARCGGHSYAGWSSTSGLIIDVTRMSGVNVSGSTAV
ncbi:MAG TPA: FAD-binding protein, partial [Streptosporangiaceae bacterium]|nr:FAD-binding protein [Streptosporangiaceae bacterium]